MKTAYCINWTEHERDELGAVTRPDGHTLHKDKETATEFLKQDFKNTPDLFVSAGTPFIVEVTEDEYNLIQVSGTIWGHVTKWRGAIG